MKRGSIRMALGERASLGSSGVSALDVIRSFIPWRSYNGMAAGRFWPRVSMPRFCGLSILVQDTIRHPDVQRICGPCARWL